jgi:hypothetical protein
MIIVLHIRRERETSAGIHNWNEDGIKITDKVEMYSNGIHAFSKCSLCTSACYNDLDFCLTYIKKNPVVFLSGFMCYVHHCFITLCLSLHTSLSN